MSEAAFTLLYLIIFAFVADIYIKNYILNPECKEPPRARNKRVRVYKKANNIVSR